ncbi:MAG TPA: alpha/beta fold hydrolase [Ramlibacter sp.]|nr:alpha/beta fold hydrolase [Ramlibacter sp.]
MPDESPLERLDRLAATAQVRWTTTEGAHRMVWRSWGRGPDVLLLHGGAGSWMHWVRNIDALAADHTVWVPDMPGFGDSDLPREAFDADAAAPVVLAGARQVMEGRPFDLVGFSFGSLVGACLAALPAPEVRRFITVGLAGLGMSGPVPEFRSLRKLTDPAEREAALRFNLLALMLSDAASIEADALRSQDNGSIKERSKGRQLARTNIVLRLAPSWQCPAFAIWGSEDKIYRGRFDELRRVAAQLHLRRLEVIEGAGHWVQYEAAARFNALLRELLAQ